MCAILILLWHTQQARGPRQLFIAAASITAVLATTLPFAEDLGNVYPSLRLPFLAVVAAVRTVANSALFVVASVSWVGFTKKIKLRRACLLLAYFPTAMLMCADDAHFVVPNSRIDPTIPTPTPPTYTPVRYL